MRSWKTVKQFAADNPWITESGVRHLIFEHAPKDKDNERSDHLLQPAVIRIGRKVLIDEPRFIDLLENLDLDEI